MRSLPLSVVLSFLFLAACGAPSGPTATPSPEAGALPELPTATLPAVVPTQLLPGATASISPTFIPSSTPDATPTPDPNEGVGALIFEESFEGASTWDWAGFSDPAATFSIMGGQLNAVMARSDMGYRFTIGPDIRIRDQQLTVVARVNLCYDQDEYGVMYRFTLTAANNYNGYILKLRCGGAARVELLRDEQFSVLLDWTPSPAIVRGAPAENKLTLWAAGDEFRFYVNERFLFSLKDPTYAAGFYGFYLRDRTAGGLSVSFDDLVAREVNR